VNGRGHEPDRRLERATRPTVELTTRFVSALVAPSRSLARSVKWIVHLVSAIVPA